ncbi:MAG: hypothetical protein FJ088_04685, partial [Deltaproteobacteria bacterium]|nr:hypothetical protein [Deltaproteobacteria bacterium]
MIRLLKSSKNACIFHKFPNDGDVAKIQTALISLKDRVTEKGRRIAGNPVIYLEKSNFYDFGDESKENLLRLCYPITSDKE